MRKSLLYSPEKGIEENLSLEKTGSYLERSDVVIWVDFPKPSKEDFGSLNQIFNFHPLSIEDCESEFHLPKIDQYEDYFFLIWHALADIPETERIETAELDIFLGSNFLVSLHHKEIPNIELIFEHYKKDPELLKRGADWLLHTLLDSPVDDYFLLVDRISDGIDELEDQIFENPTQQQVRKLFTFKHQILTVRKIAAPQRDIINTLVRYDSSLIKSPAYIYFQDIYDHLVRIIDLVDTARDVIGGAMDIYLSTVSNKLNEVMKKLTIVAIIFMPLTLITGIYGMNFRYIPELYIRYYYFGLLAFMILLAAGMLLYFKKKQWW